MYELNVEDKIASYIFKWFTIVFLVVGTICNILSAIVYSRKKMKKSSYSIYLFALAVVDLLVTWTGNLRYALMFYEIPNKTPMMTSSRYLAGNHTSEYTDGATHTLSHSSSSSSSAANATNVFNLLNATNTDIFWPGFDLRDTNIVVCRVHRFLNYYLLQFSSLLLCLLSVDRFFGCVLVLKASKFCKSTMARRFVLYSMVFLFIVNFHMLVAMGYYETVSPAVETTTSRSRQTVTNVSTVSTQYMRAKLATNGLLKSNQSNKSIFNPTSKKVQLSPTPPPPPPPQQQHQEQRREAATIFRCEADPNSSFYSKFWAIFFYIDGAIYCFIPFFIMAVCNAIIISKIIKSRKQSKQVIVKKQTRKILRHTSSGMLPSEKRLSMKLVCVSMSFFVLTIPVMVVEYLDQEYATSRAWPIIISLAYCLMYLNHVINFFFYCVMGSKFRSEIKALLPCALLFSRSKVNPVRQNQLGTTVVFETSGVPRTTFYNNNSDLKRQISSIRYVKSTSSVRLLDDERRHMHRGFSKEDYKRSVKKCMTFSQRHNLNMRKICMAFNNARSMPAIDSEPVIEQHVEEEEEEVIKVTSDESSSSVEYNEVVVRLSKANLVKKRRSIAAATFLGSRGGDDDDDEDGDTRSLNHLSMRKFYSRPVEFLNQATTNEDLFNCNIMFNKKTENQNRNNQNNESINV